jgi:hypothetical protein
MGSTTIIKAGPCKLNILMLSFEEYFHPQFKSFLKEGLIKTYPIDHLLRALKNVDYGNDMISFNIKPVTGGQNAATRYINVEIFHSGKKTFIEDSKLVIKKIKSIAETYGFFIGRLIELDQNGGITKNDDDIMTYMLSIEPKYPHSSNDTKTDLYHITYDRYIEKINKTGLTPKISKTSFSHPGNRIYLFKTISGTDLENLASAIASNRIMNIPDKILKKGMNAIDTYQYINMRDKMVYYKVDSTGLKLYEDPMVNPTSTSSAFFTTSNIPADRLLFQGYVF